MVKQDTNKNYVQAKGKNFRDNKLPTKISSVFSPGRGYTVVWKMTNCIKIGYILYD